MFDLVIDHQSLKILFLSYTLFKSSLLQLIRKLTTICICLSNSKLYTQTSKKLCYQTREGFKKVKSSTWLQTTNHLKYYSYHICRPNLACFSSLDCQLHDASTYQIASSARKPVRSYTTKPKRVLRRQEVQLGCRPLVTQNIIFITYGVQILFVFVYQILSSALKLVRSYVTKAKRVVNFFLRFQVPSIIPIHLHSLKSATNIQSTLLLSTIYQD